MNSQMHQILQQINIKIPPTSSDAIQRAIQKGDLQQVQQLLEKHLQYSQAGNYFHKIKNAFDEEKKKKEKRRQAPTYWSRIQIDEYLKERIDAVQYVEIEEIITSNQLDDCKEKLEDYLRQEETVQIMPHIINLMQSNKKEGLSWREIYGYISERISKESFQQIRQKIQNRQTLVYESMIKKKLRKKQYEYILPAIKKAMNLKKNSSIQSVVSLEEKNQKVQEFLTLIQNQMGSEQQAEFQRFEGFFRIGREMQCQQILKEFFGKKNASPYIQQMKKNIFQDEKVPLQSSILLQYEIKRQIPLYEISYKQNLVQSDSEVLNVMVVGMTGVGKSTFLNSLINRLMGIEAEDNFRYVLIKEDPNHIAGTSATKNITIYGVQKQGLMKKSIRFIDVPGIGDTEGIKKDEEHIQELKKKFETCIPSLNLVLYVLKASETRITKQSLYVMNRITQIFGKDIGENILFILTFADIMQPTILPSLQKCFPQIIERVRQKYGEWYIKVNNSVIFKRLLNQEISLFQRNKQFLDKTIERIYKMEPKSTLMTLQVIQQRQEMYTAIQCLQRHIGMSFEKQKEIKKRVKAVVEMIQGKKYVDNLIQVKKHKITKQKTNKNVMNCHNCQQTCHKSCSRKGEQIKKCVAFYQGVCRVCRCGWQIHSSQNQIYHHSLVKTTQTIEELKKMYKIMESEEQGNIHLLSELLKAYFEMIQILGNYCELLQASHDKLAQIQLRRVDHKSIVEYIEMLIQIENREKKEGFSERIMEYKKIMQYEERKHKTVCLDEKKEIKKFQSEIKNQIRELVQDQKIVNKVIEIQENTLMKIPNPQIPNEIL